MKKSGKILFFNPNEGSGIIITSQKEKITFSVEQWDDFDIMPSLGLEVVFNFEDNTAFNISSKTEEDDLLVDNILNTVSVDTLPDVPQEENPQIEDEEAPDEVDSVEEESAEESSENKQETQEEASVPQEETPSKEEKTDENEHSAKEKLDVPTRLDNVTLTLNINHAVANYFEHIEQHIKDRLNYKKVFGRLDYTIIRRFLWTMFNNLSEIDIHLITPQIRTLSNDLKATAKIYDDLLKKTKYPALAYEEVFLSCQNEYMKIKVGAQDMIDRLSRLRTEEKHVGSILKVKKEEMAKDIHTEEFDVLTHELKSLNGAYVDIVHMMAELDERYKSDLKQLKEFEKEYQNDFYELFAKATLKHKDNLSDILSAQAFLLDSKLWQEVKTSKAVKSYFKKSAIAGELNTRTYLKYYLDSLDENKALEDNKKLFDLYEYLISIHVEYVMVVSASVNDALDCESELKYLPKGYKAKSFVDEKKALKWAIHNSVKVLILEDRLRSMDVSTFLKYYQKYVLISPKIILLGDKPQTNTLSISKLLTKGVTPRVILKKVHEVLEER